MRLSEAKQQVGAAQLAELQMVSGLTDAQVEKVILRGRVKRVESGTFLFQEQDPAGQVYVLTQGKIRLSQVTPEGQQVIMRYASPVEEFGLIAVLTDSSYPVSAQTVEDCTLMVWDEAAVKDLMAAYPRLALNIIRVLSDRIEEFQERIRVMSTERVERRIARALLRLARQTGRKVEAGVLIDMPLSRQDLAEMTGTTLFTVSRVLSQWESVGLVQSGREQVIVRFPHGLVRIAEDLR
jgi:CRP-like cAMP-binding protein